MISLPRSRGAVTWKRRKELFLLPFDRQGQLSNLTLRNVEHRDKLAFKFKDSGRTLGKLYQSVSATTRQARPPRQVPNLPVRIAELDRFPTLGLRS